MSGINKKSIITLFAVALMVFSACTVIIANENPVAADNNDYIECTSGVSIVNNGTTWTSNIPEELSNCVTFDGNETLTLNNAQFRVKSDIQAAIQISNFSEGLKPFNIKIIGTNTVICQSTNDHAVEGIMLTNVDINIMGKDEITDTLLVATEKQSNTPELSIGIGDEVTSPNSCVFDSVCVTILPCDATSVYGLSIHDITMKNASSVTIFDTTEKTKITYSDGAMGVDCINLKMENKSELSIDVNANRSAYGIMVSDDFEMIDSNITINSESSNSHGICTMTHNPTNIDNSTINISVKNKALRTLDETAWDVSAFKNMIVSGGKVGEDPQPITGTTIPLDYNIIRGTPKYYTVTFNIGEGTGTTPDAVNVETGTSFNLPGNENFKRDGYTFNGWSDGVNTMNAGQSYTPTSNITLNAVWEKNSSGGSNDNTTLIVCIVLSIIILVGCGTYAYFKKFKQ